MKWPKSKSVTTPMDPSQYYDLSLSSAPSESQRAEMMRHPYRELIGALLYLSTRTRPDIATAVVVLSRHVWNPRILHRTSIKRILRYLKGIISFSLLLGPHNSNLSAYADSDWAGSADRVWTTGNLGLFGGACVGWKSTKQRYIALSSTEAEYVSLSQSKTGNNLAEKSLRRIWISINQSDNSFPGQHRVRSMGNRYF